MYIINRVKYLNLQVLGSLGVRVERSGLRVSSEAKTETLNLQSPSAPSSLDPKTKPPPPPPPPKKKIEKKLNPKLSKQPFSFEVRILKALVT